MPPPANVSVCLDRRRTPSELLEDGGAVGLWLPHVQLQHVDARGPLHPNGESVTVFSARWYTGENKNTCEYIRYVK